MKRTILLIYAVTIITTLTLGEDIIDKLARAIDTMGPEIETCSTRFNVTPEDLAKVEHLFENDEPMPRFNSTTDRPLYKVGCSISCILQQKGIMSHDDVTHSRINVDKVMEFLDALITEDISIRVRKILNECSHEEIIDECEMCVRFLVCAYRQAKHNAQHVDMYT